MNRTPWIERTFQFDIPPGWMPNILERLESTSLRIRELTKDISDDDAGIRFEDKWSIKEHIGHLIDLEDLHAGRISEFVLRIPSLRAADMSNVKTHQANHNNRHLQLLIDNFQTERAKFIEKLQMLDDETLEFKSLHPRLNEYMRPVDLAYFCAEHDDHHLATIRELRRLFL